MLGTCLVACRPQSSAHGDAQSLPTMPGPTAAAPAPGRAALNDGCVRCHSQQAEEWAASQHRTAHTDPDYQRALASERGDFCQTCHAPEAAPGREPARSEGTMGVACVTCHVPHGTDRVLAVPDPRASGSTHAVTRLAAFADVDACAGCHELAFPSNPDVAMQATISEHARSEFADVACADCHMPWIGSGSERHRSHAFAASRDPQMLRDAVVVDAQRDGSTVSLRLAPGRIGHAFPTGDLFRRLWVDAEAVDDEGDTFAYDGRALGRRFTRSGGRMLADDRPGAQDGVVEVTFDLGDDAKALPIRWRILHQRVEQPLEGDEAEIFGETLVHAGELPATRGTP
jgi:hypothetical protein